MNKDLTAIATGLIIISVLTSSDICSGQISGKIEKYFEKFPSGEPKNDDSSRTYRMTPIYTNRDLYGNFTGKTKVSGDYRRGPENGYVSWNNVYIAHSQLKNLPGHIPIHLSSTGNMSFTILPGNSIWLKSERMSIAASSYAGQVYQS